MPPVNAQSVTCDDLAYTAFLKSQLAITVLSMRFTCGNVISGYSIAI